MMIVYIDDNLSFQEYLLIKYWFFSYNFLEDLWVDIYVDFFKCLGNVKKDFVVSGVCLFFMSGDMLFFEVSQGCFRMKELLSVMEIEFVDGFLEIVFFLLNFVFDV